MDSEAQEDNIEDIIDDTYIEYCLCRKAYDIRSPEKCAEHYDHR